MVISDKRGIIIQARMSSRRFPGKMLATLGKDPLVKYVFERCKMSGVGKVAIATSTDSSDDLLCDYCRSEGIPVVRGDLNNVAKRYLDAARAQDLEYICRVGGDTPFVDIELVKQLFDILITNRLDYVGPDRKTCASGFYCETFTLKALSKVLEMAGSAEDLEHVTKYILDNLDKFSVRLIDAGLNPNFMGKVQFTIDYPEDIETGRKIAAKLPGGHSFTSRDVLKIIEAMNLCAA